MTVAIGDRKTVWTGAGAAPPLNTTFVFYDNDEVVIYLRPVATGEVASAPLIEGTDYTLTGGDGATGVVQPLASIDAGDEWIGYRVTKHDQETPFSTGGRFPASAHERALDRTAHARQDLDDDRVRSLRAPVTDDDTYADMELPPKEDRLSTIAGYDTNGQPICIVGSVDTTLISVTAVGQAIVEFATIAEVVDYLSAMTDRGDLIVGGVSGVEQRLAIGAADKILKSDGTDAFWGDIPGENLPIGIHGFDLTVDSVDAELLNCSGGTTADSTRSTLMQDTAVPDSTPDSTWVDGGPGGCAVGMAANWSGVDQLHVFLLSEADGTNCQLGFDEEIDADNLMNNTPNVATANLTLFKRIGTIHRVSASQDIEDFKQIGDWTYFVNPFDTYETNDQDYRNRSAWVAVECPIGIESIAVLDIHIEDDVNQALYITSPGMTDIDPDIAAPIGTVVSQIGAAGAFVQQGQAQVPVGLDSGVPSLAVRAHATAFWYITYTLMGYYQPLGRS